MTTEKSPTDRISERDARIRDLFLARYSDREIAKALGLHRVTVTRLRLAMGVTAADRKPPTV